MHNSRDQAVALIVRHRADEVLLRRRGHLLLEFPVGEAFQALRQIYIFFYHDQADMILELYHVLYRHTASFIIRPHSCAARMAERPPTTTMP